MKTMNKYIQIIRFTGALVFCSFVSTPNLDAQAKPVIQGIQKQKQPAPSVNSNKPATANKVITIQELAQIIIYPKDIEITFNKYSDAKDMCKMLNNTNSFGYNRWRIPTKQEIQLLYAFRSKIRGWERKGKYVSSGGLLDASTGIVNESDGWKEQNFVLRPILSVTQTPVTLGVVPPALEFSPMGGTKNVDVLTNVEDWEVENETDQWTITAGKTSFTVSCNVNPTDNDIENKIKIIADNKEEYVTIKQEAVKIELSTHELTLPSSGTTTTITVKTNMNSWEIISSPTWCRLDKYDDYFLISGEENAKNARADVLIVKAGNKEETVVIAQKGTNAAEKLVKGVQSIGKKLTKSVKPAEKKTDM